MPTMKLTSRQDVEDFVRGCTFFATGGGGLPDNGIRSLMDELAAGREVGWVDIEEISDDALSVCPFLMGSIAPLDDETKAEMAGYGMTPEASVNPEGDRLAKAILALGEYIGKSFDVVVPIELAGANTPGPIAAATRLGMVTVDGDYTSRAIPEIVQITFNYHGRPMLPIASVDEWGNVCIIKESINPRVTEKLGKLISVAGYGLAGQAGLVQDGKGLKETLIPGTLTESYETGKLLRETREQGQDPVQALIKAIGGYELCRGTITNIDDYNEGGYYWGTVTVDCREDTFKYWFKNENHIVWKNDIPFVSSPDLISAIDTDTGEPVPNPLAHVGQRIALVGVPCKPQLECPECYAVLTPEYFGFEIKHVPIREVMHRTDK